VIETADATRRGITLSAEETDRLYRISARVNAGVSVGQILDAVFEEFRPILPYDRMDYTNVDDGGRLLTTTWVRATYEPVILGVGHIVELERSIKETLIPGSPPFLENDVQRYASERPEDHPGHKLLAEGIRAVMSCPMFVGDEAIGMLFISSRSEICALIAGISHELRNPLTSVVGLSMTLRDSLEKLDEGEAAVLIGILARESSEAAGIVEDLLTVSRHESGRLEVSPEVRDLRGEVDHVVAAWQTPERKVRVDGSNTWVLADPLRVRQIIRNLVSNAFKYGGETIWINVRSTEDGGVVEVFDDGPGIPEADRETIFEMYGTSAESTGRGEAVGVGLAMSRQLADAMNGDLTYQFENGVSSFVLRLPRTDAEAQATRWE
jgi:anti-sigma regulatory factor (Ser/Thr protein kinase)